MVLPKSSHNTPTPFLYFLFIPLSLSLFQIQALNITSILSHYPHLSSFTALLPDLDFHTPLTIIAVPNSHFPTNFPTTFPTTFPANFPATLRYHVLLKCLTLSDLRHTPLSGTPIPSLAGTLNLTGGIGNSFRLPANSSVTANVISLVKTVPFSLSIFTVDSLLIPYGSDLIASETHSPPPVNITGALIGGHKFNVAAAMLIASGVVEEFERDEGGAGITMFIPTDEAFANLPETVDFPALSAGKKALVLKFHVLHSYYPLGSLESIVNPVEPTLATEENRAGSFTLNIRRVNGSVAIDSGLVRAVISQTVFDQNPVAIFGVSRVLLPKEIFGNGKEKSVILGAVPGVGARPPSVGTQAPETSPGYRGASHLSASSPGLMTSGGSRRGGIVVGGRNWSLLLLMCIVCNVVLL